MKNVEGRPAGMSFRFRLIFALMVRPLLIVAVGGTTMSEDEKGATESQVEKIDAIKGSEVLGYEGAGREEHSGENSPRESEKLTDDLADNKPDQVK